KPPRGWRRRSDRELVARDMRRRAPPHVFLTAAASMNRSLSGLLCDAALLRLWVSKTDAAGPGEDEGRPRARCREARRALGNRWHGRRLPVAARVRGARSLLGPRPLTRRAARAPSPRPGGLRHRPRNFCPAQGLSARQHERRRAMLFGRQLSDQELLAKLHQA